MNYLAFDFEDVMLRDVTNSESDGIQHFSKSEIRGYLKSYCNIFKIFAAQCVGFGGTFCPTCLRSLGQIDWKYRPKYGRFSIFTVYKHLEVTLQIAMIFIIHC